MNAKSLIPISLVSGLIGGVLGSWVMSAWQSSATFETVRVTKDLIVAPAGENEKGCRLSPNGTITATGGMVANQVRGNLVVGNSLIASLNATQQTLENQQIVAQMTAIPDRGGELVLRSRDGVFCPGVGPVVRGYETVLGFNKDNSTPTLYTRNVAQGEQGRAFLLCAKPKPQQQQQQPDAAAQQPYDQASRQQAPRQ